MEKNRQDVGKLTEDLQQKIANIQTMDEFTEWVDEMMQESEEHVIKHLSSNQRRK